MLKTLRPYTPNYIRAQTPDTADGWAQRVANRGGTFSAATLTALRALDYDLALFGLKSRMIYLNMRCGSDITAAKCPLIARAGPGFDVASGSFDAWDEANGLKNSSAGVMNTGISCWHPKLLDPNNISVGVYSLADESTSNFSVGVFSNGQGWNGLVLNTSGYQFFDAAAGKRVQTDNSLTSDGGSTKGLMAGSRWNSGSAAVFRNGVIRGTTANTAGAFPVGSSGAPPDASFKVFGAYVTSGGDFVGLGLTPDDVSNLTWIMHAFNASLATPRQVTAEGLS